VASLPPVLAEPDPARPTPDAPRLAAPPPRPEPPPEAPAAPRPPLPELAAPAPPTAPEPRERPTPPEALPEPPPPAPPPPVAALPAPRPAPAPAPPRQQTARPPSQQQEAARAFPPGSVFMPGGLNLQQARPAPAAPPAGRPEAGGIDLRVDPRLLEGRATSDPSVRVTGANVGADWRAAFRRWLDQNIRYPRRAIELREMGAVRVVVTASPDGRVRDIRLVGPSASPSLNTATTFPFSGAQLPAFPPPADPNGVTIELTVNYILIMRR
jgi:TonB family protein